MRTMIVSVWKNDGIQIREASRASTILHPLREKNGEAKEKRRDICNRTDGEGEQGRV